MASFLHHYRSYTSLRKNISSRRCYQGVGLVGVCEDRNSSYLQGPAKAPSLIRQALHCYSSNTYSELGVDAKDYLHDYGDISFASPDAGSMYKVIKSRLQMLHAEGLIPLLLGGDHSVSYPAVKALVDIIQMPVTIVHFDAHPDIYPLFEGNLWSHASPFARILESSGLCSQLISIGVRTITKEQREVVDKYGVQLIEARHFPAKGQESTQHLYQQIIGQ